MRPRRNLRTALVLPAALTVAAASALVAVAPSTAGAAAVPEIVVADGVTQPVFGFADAIRERLWVDSPYDSDKDGARDKIAIDIKRPAATAEGLQVPVVMDPSPYYSTLGRGNESELKADVDGDGLLDKWPLFYDNYFVPRGYAVVLMDMIGTNNSTGCPTVHDESDNLSAKVVIDWLNGRARAFDAAGTEQFATWDNGKSALIGKSYDGTLANAVAASGVEGLTTIVPISAISSYHDYTRSNGVILRGNNYLASLANTVTNPERRGYCKPVRDVLDANDGDETGDYSQFWEVRDYLKDVKKVKASVFVYHGLNDDNVMPDHFSKWWYALAKQGVPRKIWLSQEGHVDPFDSRRADWVDTLHRWFDYWLQGVQNGIMDEPIADVERAPDVWATYADWPAPGATDTRLWFRSSVPGAEGDGAAGGFGYVQEKGAEHSLTFRDAISMSRNSVQSNLTTASPNKLVFMSDTLSSDVHISGTPSVQMTASVDATDTNFGAVLIDLGADTRINWTSGDGVLPVTATTPEDCWGESSPLDDACYKQVTKRLVTADREVVTEGVVDALNLTSRRTATALEPGRDYVVDFPLLPEDYVFKAGHRIAVVIVGSYSGYSSQADRNQANITVSVKRSRITLPIVGGQQAARNAGI
ncbi:Xaa-Pro dipeptidyl-peptidase [Motilibacter deserti]|uniref:CocE/NonD family hydrolase n=1 Tax=Motilibacter deserti TaxID=2714956 RepID=A0ABX0GTB6_9ACTN|nr:Xaa-Pro dipeptidyl-peptidase [Motilibacter deserti]NHC13765.1 CocE/NonD family hydrolase [Motilibacter deserti]